MKTSLFAAASALALIGLAAPAAAQHAHMPGMHMPAPKKPVAKKAPAKTKAVPKKAAAKTSPAKKAATPAKKKAATKRPAAVKKPAPVAAPLTHEHHGPAAAAPLVAPEPHDHKGHVGTAPATTGLDQPSVAPPVADQGTMGHSQMDHSATGHAQPAEHAGAHGGTSGHSNMVGAFGPYSLNREASGTAWQPDTSDHSGLHQTRGGWDLMAHGVVNLVYDHQGGARGDSKAFASGMLMGMARRPLGNGTLQFKTMLSPDPLMGKRGYPLLLASGETADGEEHLIDRQHPHDFFMEMAASLSQNIGRNSSVFLYGGLPGEPAFGPPAFMHREAIMDSPEAPISHHWLDSTHISFGVLTAGVVLDRFKIEASRFNGREPDQHRWNIETGPLDSAAVRVSWNPTSELSLQGSWGKFKEPEQLEPGVDQKRWSASALFAHEVAPNWKLAGTMAWGRKTVDHHGETWRDDAFVAEAGLKHRAWTLFSRGEITENRELLDDEEEHGDAFRVGKVSVGAVRDFRLSEHFSIGAGGLFALNFVHDALEPFYGKRIPKGAMGFVRLKLD